MNPFNNGNGGAANQGNWMGQQGLQLQNSYTTVELNNASTLIGKLKARRDELRRLLSAQQANQAEIEKIEAMLAAAGESGFTEPLRPNL